MSKAQRLQAQVRHRLTAAGHYTLPRRVRHADPDVLAELLATVRRAIAGGNRIARLRWGGEMARLSPTAHAEINRAKRRCIGGEWKKKRHATVGAIYASEREVEYRRQLVARGPKYRANPLLAEAHLHPTISPLSASNPRRIDFLIAQAYCKVDLSKNIFTTAF